MIEYGCIVGGVLDKEMTETLLVEGMETVLVVEGMETVLVVEGILLAVGKGEDKEKRKIKINCDYK